MVFRWLRKEKVGHFLVVPTLVVMVALSFFLFRKVGEFVEGDSTRALKPQVDPEILERLFSATAGLLTIGIIQRLLVERQRFNEERRLLDTELAHVSRVSTAGVMMSGITHELAPPLSAISNNSAALRNMLRSESASGNDSMKESNDRMGKEALRAASILGELRGFVASTKPRRTFFDLNELIHEAVERRGSLILKKMQVRNVATIARQLTMLEKYQPPIRDWRRDVSEVTLR